MNTNIKFLKTVLEKSSIRQIKIRYKEGQAEEEIVTTLNKMAYLKDENETFIFSFEDVNGKYAIEFDSISDIIISPFASGIITIIQKDGIKVEIHFNI